MTLVKLTLKKKGKKDGESIFVNTDHIVYYRKYETDTEEKLTAIFTADKMLVVLESTEELEGIFKYKSKVIELCQQTV